MHIVYAQLPCVGGPGAHLECALQPYSSPIHIHIKQPHSHTQKPRPFTATGHRKTHSQAHTHRHLVAAPSATLDGELREIGKVMVEEWLEEAGAAGQQVIDAYNAM